MARLYPVSGRQSSLLAGTAIPLGEYDRTISSSLKYYFGCYLAASDSVDVERSFLQYKYLLSDRRESLTEDHKL